MQKRMVTLSMMLAAALRLHAAPVTVLSAAETAMPLAPIRPEVRFAVMLDGIDAAQLPVRLPVIHVTRDGVGVPRDAFSAVITRGRELVITIDRWKVREPGKYAITMQVPAVGAAESATVAVSLIRPAAELRIRTPLRITRTAGLCIGAPASAPPITIEENGGRSGITPPQKSASFELRQGDDVVGHGTLATNFVRAGTAVQAPLTFDAPATGRFSGVMTIRAPELATGKFEQTIEIVSRLSWWWLVPTIVLGLLGGIYFRHVLENRRKRLEALAQGWRQYWKTENLLAATAGADAAKQLQAALDDFGAVLADVDATPEQISGAATALQNRAQDIIKKTNEEQIALKAKADGLTAKVGEPEGLPRGVGDEVAKLRLRLDDAAQKLKDGELGEVASALDSVDADAARALKVPLAEWKTGLTAIIPSLAGWPDIAGFDETMTRWRTALAAVDGASPWADQLAACRRSVAILKTEVVPTLSENVPRLAGYVVEQLTSKGATKEELDRIRAAGTAVRQTAGNAAMEPRDLADRLGDVAQSVDGVIRRLAQAANEKDPALPGTEALTALGIHAFATAAATLPVPRKEVAADKKGSPAPPIAAPNLHAEAQRASASPQMTVRIVAIAGDFIVRKNVTFQAVLENTSAKPVRSDWLFDGVRVQSKDLQATWSPLRSGSQQVRVTVHFESGSAVSSEIRILVAAAFAPIDSKKLGKEAARVRLLQNVGAGILLTGLGVLIFQSTFIGTFADFFAAFGWGFATDVGFARVIDLFKTDRSPFPAPAAPAGG